MKWGRNTLFQPYLTPKQLKYKLESQSNVNFSEGSTPPKDKDVEIDEIAVGSPPTQDEDFVSDAFGESQISEDDIRREMEEQLKQSTDEEGRKRESGCLSPIYVIMYFI